MVVIVMILQYVEYHVFMDNYAFEKNIYSFQSC